MRQGKLNCHHPISASSGSTASVFTISEVVSEGTEDVVSRRWLAIGDILLKRDGLCFFGYNSSYGDQSLKNFFVSDSSSGILCAVNSRI